MGAVIVTGGAGSIGTAITRRFAAEGAEVVVADVDGEGARETAAALAGEAIGVEVDVADHEAVEAMVDRAVSAFGGIDVLVNNAGVFQPAAPIEAQSLAEWERVVDVHLKGSYLCTKAALPHLREGRAIVNISSVAGIGGFVHRTAYGPAKAGIVNLTKTLAAALSEDVRVNAVAPGFVRTRRLEASLEAGKYTMAELLERIPQNEIIEPDHVADAVAYLASDRARSITGVTLPVDGGQLALLL